MDENGMRISCTAESNPAKKGLAKIEIFGFRINIIKYDLYIYTFEGNLGEFVTYGQMQQQR